MLTTRKDAVKAAEDLLRGSAVTTRGLGIRVPSISEVRLPPLPVRGRHNDYSFSAFIGDMLFVAESIWSVWIVRVLLIAGAVYLGGLAALIAVFVWLFKP